jgi:transcriptional regulator with XRE-family HTH domain
MEYKYKENSTTEEEIEKAVVELEEEDDDRNDYFRVGLARRFYNKNLKEAIGKSGMNYSELQEKVSIHVTSLSNIVNFKRNPSEDQRIRIAMVLETPIDHLFPEKYDELYRQIAPLKKTAEIKIKVIELDNPEVLKLRSGEDRDYFENKADKVLLEVKFKKLKILEQLSKRERRMIELRFGFTGDKPCTFEEIGQEFGVGSGRIQQIVSRALDKIKKNNPQLENYFLNLT